MESDFQFVSVVPTADGRPKPNRQALVRKNAAKFQWRHNKHTKAKASIQKASVASTSSTDRSVILVEQDVEDEESQKQVAPELYGLHGSRARLQTYVFSHFQDEKVAKTMSFNSQVILPVLMPSNKSSEHPGTKAWLQIVISDPLLSQVWTYHTEMHYRVMFGRPLNAECNLLTLYGTIIKSLNERMQNPETACSDANILCVSGMAVYGGPKEKRTTRSRWPNQGPLMMLNGASVYGQLRSVSEHIKGQDLLIKLRGGIDKLELPGMAAMLSLTDISESMRKLVPIKHPYIPWNEGPVIIETLNNAAEGLPNSMPNIGLGFPAEWKHSDFKPLQDLSTALRYVAAYTVLVYNHCEGISIHSVGTLADKRNSVLHRLLSLPAYPYKQYSETIYQFYERTRLALRMYSLTAVYPSHPDTAPFEELAILLRKELSHLDLGNITYEESMLLLWILVMGAIVTIDTAGRPWFISALSPVSRRLQLESWHDMKSILTNFLWLDMTNDTDGRDVWDEVRLEHARTARFSSSPSVGSSSNLTIRTQSSSPAEVIEIPDADQSFSTDW